MQAEAAPGSSPAGELPAALPLFPLQSVLFPDGLLGLKVFETRYLDLVSRCLRSGEGFGVVALRQGSEVRRADERVDLDAVGTLAEILDVDSPRSGILQLRCRGGARFRLAGTRQQADGLWIGEGGERLPDDEPVAPAARHAGCVEALRRGMEALRAQGADPFLAPLRFDEAGWVANRWCEILPISVAAKQKLMALDDPLLRLQLVDDYLREKGVVG